MTGLLPATHPAMKASETETVYMKVRMPFHYLSDRVRSSVPRGAQNLALAKGAPVR